MKKNLTWAILSICVILLCLLIVFMGKAKMVNCSSFADEQVAIIKQAIEKYGSPDEIKYDYSIAPQWIKQRLAL